MLLKLIDLAPAFIIFPARLKTVAIAIAVYARVLRWSLSNIFRQTD